MNYAAIYEKPEEATLEELGKALGEDNLGYEDEQAIYAELRRRDALCADYKAALDEACHDAPWEDAMPVFYLQQAAARRLAEKGGE